jgi:hypothetical protein
MSRKMEAIAKWAQTATCDPTNVTIELTVFRAFDPTLHNQKTGVTQKAREG